MVPDGREKIDDNFKCVRQILGGEKSGCICPAGRSHERVGGLTTRACWSGAFIVGAELNAIWMSLGRSDFVSGKAMRTGIIGDHFPGRCGHPGVVEKFIGDRK